MWREKGGGMQFTTMARFLWRRWMCECRWEGGETGQRQKLQRCKDAFHFLTIHAVLQKTITLDKTKVCAVLWSVCKLGAHYPIHEKTMEDCEQKRRQTTCMQALTGSLMSFLESSSRSRERMVAMGTYPRCVTSPTHRRLIVRWRCGLNKCCG
jgi:hypothetical protein